MKPIVTAVILMLLASMLLSVIPDRFSSPSLGVLSRVVANNQTAPRTQPGSTTPATNGKLYPNAQPSSKRFQISLPPLKSSNGTVAQTLGTNSWAIAAELSPGSNVPNQINGVEVVAYLPSIPSGLSGLQYWYSEVFTLSFPNGIAFQLAMSAYGALTRGCTYGPCYVAQYDYSSTGSTCSIDQAPVLGSGGTLSGGEYWVLAVWWGGSSSGHWNYGIGYGRADEGPFTIWKTGTLVSLQQILSSVDSYSYINAYSDGTCRTTHVDQPFAAVESYDVTQSDWTSLIETIEFGRAINYYVGSGTTSWPSMTWATGAVWIGSQSYNQQDVNGNYYDSFLGSISPPSWAYVAGCMQGTPSPCTSGSSGTYNEFRVGYGTGGAVPDSGASTSLLWALPPSATWSLSPQSVSPGQSFTMSYTVANPNGFDMIVGLGASIRQDSNPSNTYSDTTHDTALKASLCAYACNRQFTVSSSAPLGSYDVAAALWSGKPGQSPYVTLWGPDWKTNALTLQASTYSVTFAENNIPSGVTWGVTVGGIHYQTSSGTSISVSGLTGTVSYSYDSPVSGSGGSYSCTSSCSGQVSGSGTVTATYTFSSSTYSVTFAENNIPSGTSWGVTVGGTHHSTSSGTSIPVSGLSGTVSYTYDSPVSGSGGSYSCTSNCSGSVSGSETVTATYTFTQTETISVSTDMTSYAQGQSIQYTASGFIQGHAVESCLTTSDIAYNGLCVGQANADSNGNAVGSMFVGTNIPAGPQMFWVVDTSSNPNVDSNLVQLTITSGYSATFAESGIPSGTTWGVTVGGTHYQTSSGTSIQVSGLTGTVSYSYDSPVSGSGGSYTCTSSCSGSVSGAGTVTATYTVSFDFRLSNSGSALNLGGISVVQGSSGSITIAVSLVSGSAESVGLSCSGAAGVLPSGVSCSSFSPGSGSPPFSSTLAVFASSSTPTGYYTLKVTGTAGALGRSTLFTLAVIAFGSSIPAATSLLVSASTNDVALVYSQSSNFPKGSELD